MKKIVFLFTGNFELSGQMFHFVKGQTVDVLDHEAEKLVRDKCAEYWKPKKAVVNDNKNKQ